METLFLSLFLFQIPMGSGYVPAAAPSVVRPVILLVPGVPIVMAGTNPTVLE